VQTQLSARHMEGAVRSPQALAASPRLPGLAAAVYSVTLPRPVRRDGYAGCAFELAHSR
jgi:hypothetical protein